MDALERAYLAALKAAAKPRRMTRTIYGGLRVPAHEPGAIMVEGYGPSPDERKAAQILWSRGIL